MFATCSFPEFDPTAGGVPVRTSRGYPRYRLRYPLVHAMPLLFPDKRTLTWPRDLFTTTYREGIVSAGVDAILASAREIREAAGVAEDTPLVLMCFEQLAKTAGTWCHRSIFAQVWEELTGEKVPELGAVPRPETRAQEQQLF